MSVSSRIAEFYKKPIAERLALLSATGLLTAETRTTVELLDSPRALKKSQASPASHDEAA